MSDRQRKGGGRRGEKERVTGLVGSVRVLICRAERKGGGEGGRHIEKEEVTGLIGSVRMLV